MLKIIISTLALAALSAPVQAFERAPTDYSSQQQDDKRRHGAKPQGQQGGAPRTTQPRLHQPTAQPRLNQQGPSQSGIRQQSIQHRNLQPQNIQQTGQQRNLHQQNIQQRNLQRQNNQQTGQQKNLQQQNIQQTGQQRHLQQQTIQRSSVTHQGISPDHARRRLDLEKANRGNYQELLQKQGVRRSVLQQRVQQNTIQQRALQRQFIEQRINAARLGAGPGRPALRRANFAHVHFTRLGNNKIWPVYRGQRRYLYKGAWRTFVPLTALGVVLVGGTYLYADGYIPVGRRYCEGLTPDGCHLSWRAVEFEEGGEEWQCVQYCPRPDVLPPPRTVALVAPPPPPPGRCEISIFSEPNFGSPPVTTSEDQAELSASGWADQIASLQIKAGVWEVFSDEQFGGQSMRLEPGDYPTLESDFDRQIGSFMCVEPTN